MRALRLDMEYDGGAFAGWAVQPGRRTIEGALRGALDLVVRSPYELRVAGRTDAGVHATGQVAGLATEAPIAPMSLARALGGLLPRDVAVRRVTEMPPGFDARRDARSRTYEYRLLRGAASPLRRGRVLHVRGALDTDAMAAATAGVVGVHDFQAFTPTRTVHRHFNRTIMECAWHTREDELVLRVRADAFLRHMVRVLVGTLLLVGRGTWTAERFLGLLEGAPRSASGPTAPAHPLTLVDVEYDPSGSAPAGTGLVVPIRAG